MSRGLETSRQIIGKFFQSVPLYHLTLRGPVPRHLRPLLPDPWPGDKAIGRRIVNEKLFFIANHKVDWQGVPADQYAYLHSFEWMRHLREVGSNSARRKARQMLTSWIDHNRKFHPSSWRSDVMGKRLAVWIGLYDFCCASADDEFQHKFFSSLVQQARHLNRAIGWEKNPLCRLLGLKGLILASITLTQHHKVLTKSVRALIRELKMQLLEDGGHFSRNPEAHLYILQDLIDIRAALRQSRLPVPDIISTVIEKLAPLVRFFRHGDGRLAEFQNSSRSNGDLIDLILSKSDIRARPPETLRSSGFERIQQGTSLLLVQTKAFDHNPEGGLSIEFSMGRDRLIRRSGAMIKTFTKSPKRQEEHWQPLADFVDPFANISSLSPTVKREQTQDYCLLTLESKAGELNYHRTLYLADEGTDLRGEEYLGYKDDSLKKGVTGISRRVVFFFEVGQDFNLTIQDSILKLSSLKAESWIFKASQAARIKILAPNRFALLTTVEANAPLQIKWALRKNQGHA